MKKLEAYQALSDLIYKGFLTMNVEIAGSLFVFKTINDKEYDLIKLSATDSKDKNKIVKFNLFFIAYSVLMINGKNMLIDREKRIEFLYELFSNFPHIFCNRIVNELISLRSKYYEATPFFEGFSYTKLSRRYWQIARNDRDMVKLSGIPGVDKIGLNSVQENWIYINQVLDEEEKNNDEFSLAVLISSASNPKGARSIRARHDANMEKKEEHRRKLAREGTIFVSQWKPEGWAVSVDTVEDLVAELDRQMNGVKDKHDLFIDEHIRKITEENERKRLEEEKRLEEIRSTHTGPAISGGQRALTPEEAEKLLQKSNNLSIVTPEESVGEEQRFLNKVGSRVLRAKEI